MKRATINEKELRKAFNEDYGFYPDDPFPKNPTIDVVNNSGKCETCGSVVFKRNIGPNNCSSCRKRIPKHKYPKEYYEKMKKLAEEEVALFNAVARLNKERGLLTDEANKKLRESGAD